MSEQAPVRGVVIAHGSMADGLVDAVRQITGVGTDVLTPISNRGLSPDALSARIEEVVGDAPAVVFVDLQAGSCGFMARRVCRGRDNQAVVFGVNLPQLLDFATHRDLGVAELVKRSLDRGRASIACAPAETEDHAGHSVSGG